MAGGPDIDWIQTMITTDREMFQQFDELGYVVIRGLLDVHLDIRPVVEEYEARLNELADEWYIEGRISDQYQELPFGKRLMKMVAEAGARYGQHFDISLPQKNITESTPMHHGPAVFDLLRSPRLLDTVEDFVGPEIYCNPVQHTRIKLPEHNLPDKARDGLSARIAWHQDLGVIDAEADQTDMLTVWFPITESTLNNGCLAVVPRSHRDELVLHCRSRDPLIQDQVCIPERLVQGKQVPLPMQPGDVLFMHRCTQHSGLPNRSHDIRWSFDLRYHVIGAPTGRPWFPGFIARSRAHPDRELRDPDKWAQLWRNARTHLATGKEVQFNRWATDDQRCA